MVSLMWWLLFVLLALQEPSIPVDTPPLADSPSFATVEFSLTCPVAAHRVFSDGAVSYNIWRGDVSNPDLHVVKTLRWTSRSPKALQWSVRLPSGVYSYEVVAQHGGGNRPIDFVCSSYQYVATLPGATRRVVDTMRQGLGDPVPRVYVYGVAPKAIKISVVRFLKNVSCGSALASAAERPIDLDRDAVGYYASDSYRGAVEAGAVFGVRVQTAGGMRTFKTIADYPNAMLAPPTSVRFDLTPAMLSAASKMPADSMLCIPSDRLVGRFAVPSQNRVAEKPTSG